MTEYQDSSLIHIAIFSPFLQSKSYTLNADTNVCMQAMIFFLVAHIKSSLMLDFNLTPDWSSIYNMYNVVAD